MERLFVVLLISTAALAQRRFTNIAAHPELTGLRYRRTPSHTHVAWLRTLARSLRDPIPFTSAIHFPWGTHGQPGVAVADFDGDGVDDIFVTNGPGAANSLFLNRFPTTGRLFFSDVGTQAGVASTNRDNTGVCYGDLNGDGRPDLVVLSEFSANQIFLSTGPATFRELPWRLATGDENIYPSSSCAVGDVNNDGRLDILVSNGVPRGDYLACLSVPFANSAPNQLFLNEGQKHGVDLSFRDVSISSGINDIGGDIPPGNFSMSWTGTLVDINLDGNLDIVLADDQCGHPTKEENPERGVNRGALRVQLGNGHGEFKTRTLEPVNVKKNGRRIGGESWMGLGFGDFNCDGAMDIFGSNFGDYHAAKVAVNEGRVPRTMPGSDSSRWWLGSPSGERFTDASVNETGPTVFGWGNGVCDYDNDGDQDIFMVGSLDEPQAAGSDNPNVIYKNSGCNAKFSYDLESMEPTGTLRNYNGLAIGDFNMDGYPDIVAASGYVSKPQSLTRVVNYSSPLDKTAFFTDILDLRDDFTFRWTGKKMMKGDMMVQINSETDRSKCWVSVRPLGMRGVIRGGLFNRGGLGATILVKPEGMQPVMAPIVSGESFGSQHSPRRNFGLGRKCSGIVDILWPQGVRNRLYDVGNREMLTMPEVPCSFAANWGSEYKYKKCVSDAVQTLTRRQVVSKKFGFRLARSALRARDDYIQGL